MLNTWFSKAADAVASFNADNNITVGPSSFSRFGAGAGIAASTPLFFEGPDIVRCGLQPGPVANQSVVYYIAADPVAVDGGLWKFPISAQWKQV